MVIRVIKIEGDVYKMELKNLSENCLDCKCRTCKATYKLDNNSSCYTWCEENCKGKNLLILSLIKNAMKEWKEIMALVYLMM